MKLENIPDETGLAVTGRNLRWFWPVFCLAAAAAIFFGIARTAKGVPLYWSKPLILDGLQYGGAGLLLALAARWLFPRHPRTVVLVAVGAYLAVGVGVAESAAAALLFLSCCCCGSLALRTAFPSDGRPIGVSKAFVTGLACELALFGVLIHFPINTRASYTLLLAAPVLAWLALQRGQPDRRLPSLDGRRDLFEAVPFWFFVFAVGVIGFAARYAFLPAVDYDNNSEHLRLWTELTYRHRFFFDVLSQVWNVEPFAVDLTRAIPSLVAARDARTAVALGLLALTLRQIWVIGGKLGLKDLDRLLLLVLLASTPMTGWLVASMQAELFLALLATTGVRLILESRAETGRSDAAAIVAVAALCCATKLPGAVLGVFLLLAAALKLVRGQPAPTRLIDPARQWPLAIFVAIFTVTALGSYATAWRVTGNPLFPLYNGHFKSPYFPPIDFSDQRWIKGFTPANMVRLFFKTSDFGENSDFVAGFQYLFLLPAGLVALFWRPRKEIAWIICLPLLGFFLMMFSQTQYMRYMFPVLPVATVVIGALLAPGSIGASGKPAIRAFALLCVVLNLAFYPGASWIFATSPQLAYSSAGKTALIRQLAPAKTLVDELNSEGPSGAVLFPQDTPFGASLLAEPVYRNWYATGRQARFGEIRSEDDVAAFLKQEGVRHVIWDTSEQTPPGAPSAFLEAYLSHRAMPERLAGGYIRYAVVDRPPSYHLTFDLTQAIAAKSDALDLPAAAASSFAQDGLKMTSDSLVVAHVATNWASIVRYHARFRCADPAGVFIAQINWDRGGVYFRPVHCQAGTVDFEEAIPTPAGATRGDLYASVRDTPQGVLTQLSLESN